jgi:chromosome segregation ATPase
MSRLLEMQQKGSPELILTTDPLPADLKLAEMNAEQHRLYEEIYDRRSYIAALEESRAASRYGRQYYESDSIRQLCGDLIHPEAKVAKLNAEIERVRIPLAEAEKKRAELLGKIPQFEQKVGIWRGRELKSGTTATEVPSRLLELSKKYHNLIRERKLLVAQVEAHQSRLQLLDLAERRLKGEHISMQAPTIDRLLHGSFGNEEKLERIANARSEPRAALEAGEKRRLELSREIGQVHREIIGEFRTHVQPLQKQLDALCRQAEAVSSAIDDLGYSLPETVRPARAWLGLEYFRQLSGGSAFRMERLGKIESEVIAS